MIAGQSDTGKGNILVVDDYPDSVRELTSWLLDEGYLVQGAHSGEEALRLVCENPPDLILLDVRMPEMDGFEVCRRIKADENLSSIPVLFLSGLSDIQEKGGASRPGELILLPNP
ncbi:MAG: response regulator [Anaerolineaceae bacterium]|nr:response regulator [Anaerolineaceae bacterium]